MTKLAPDQGLWPLVVGTELRLELIRRGLLNPDPMPTPTHTPADLPLDRWGVLSALEDIRVENPVGCIARYPRCVQPRKN